MDQSDEAKAQAMVLQRVLEGIGAKLKAEKGLTDEQIGLAMLATGLNTLSRAWSGRELVGHLFGVVSALMEVHGIQPNGEHIPRGRPNWRSRSSARPCLLGADAARMSDKR